MKHLGKGPILIVRQCYAGPGRGPAGGAMAVMRRAMPSSRRWPMFAQGLVLSGVRRLVVAGGETSGAVVDRLRIPGFLVGAEIAAGVPVLRGRRRQGRCDAAGAGNPAISAPGVFLRCASADALSAAQHFILSTALGLGSSTENN